MNKPDDYSQARLKLHLSALGTRLEAGRLPSEVSAITREDLYRVNKLLVEVAMALGAEVNRLP